MKTEETILKKLLYKHDLQTLLNKEEAQLANHFSTQYFTQILQLLPLKYRSVLLLYFIANISRNEIAARLHISPGTVHNRLHKGIYLLKTQFIKKPKNPV